MTTIERDKCFIPVKEYSVDMSCKDHILSLHINIPFTSAAIKRRRLVRDCNTGFDWLNDKSILWFETFHIDVQLERDTELIIMQTFLLQTLGQRFVSQWKSHAFEDDN
jgi:hypothetical protein